MKRLSKRRSISKTHPARHTDHSHDSQDEEIATQNVKFASLHKQDKAWYEDDDEQEEDEAEHTMNQKHKKMLKFSSIKNGVNNQQQQRQQQQQQQEMFICSQCGKGFQSLKAKCGHMACHSEKEKAPSTKLVSKLKLQTMDDSHSETESGAKRLTRRSRRAIRYKKHNSVAVVTSKAAKVDVFKNCSSEDSEVEQELANVAINLMLLSRDSANWGGLNSVGDSSDNNSVVLESRSISTKLPRKAGNSLSNEHLIDEASKKFATVLGDSESLKVSELDEGSKTEPHLSLRKLKRAFDAGLIRDGEECNQSKRPKMDMFMTNFRAPSPYESGDNSFETDESLDTRKGKGILELDSSNVGDKSKKGKHECQVCYKVFKSGQALGGHRRVHLSEESDEIKRDEVSVNFKQSENQLLHHFIDLNLPAPIEDDEASDSMAGYH